ncbi:Bug family tripartite tricarboxylate transporter substrate binding protein [Variovorax saccharolyticus]|uniref:Bug family tripartite tricarboxylate transporter substrate binding protein n=1 Tax=Variovorax saccharolyticus TaxID=3053516 RepID=UPI0025774319|nr:tripartite tricarboxylate transporter substrate binding protein [Variovorax sp. J31P216]MDM0024353.1 tripartite tricarboxylate transporter substrate binding protein [Variovorax sp. J31P216]
MTIKSFNTRRRSLAALFACATLAGAALLGEARADAYPTRPITIVVAYPAGGDTDVLARLIADKLGTRLGQPVVVDNRSGAAGTIGTAYVSKARADGYTLLLAPNTIAITPHVLKGVAGASVDPATDLTSIVQLGTQSLFVVAASATGVTSVKDLVVKVKEGKITSYASPGNGSPMHILGELFDKSAGVKITQVPYRGSMPAVADMVGGQVPMMYSTLGPVAPHIKAGKLVPLAVADSKRSPFLPDVPTLAEQGYKGAEVGAWQALMGPRGMPVEQVQLLNRHVNEILKMPDVIARMEAIALAPAGGDPASLAKLVAGDYARYGKLVSEFGIKAE